MVWRNVEKRKLRFEGVEAFRRVIIRRQEEFGCLLSAYGYQLLDALLPIGACFLQSGGRQVIGFAVRRLLI